MAPAVIYDTQPDEAPQLINKAALKDASLVSNGSYDCKEDYNGDYRFAPIEEAQVSRAMIKRYACLPPIPLPSWKLTRTPSKHTDTST